MKKLQFALLCILVPVLLAVPVLGADLAGGYYVTGDSAIGSGLTFYVPADFAQGSLTYDSSGNLFNLTNSSIYLYCPDYPDYTIYAPRFSVFQYRQSSGAGYQYQDLNLRSITDSNVEILVEDPGMSPGTTSLLVMILSVLCIISAVIILIPRR